jgi:hypothetical protein
LSGFTDCKTLCIDLLSAILLNVADYKARRHNTKSYDTYSRCAAKKHSAEDYFFIVMTITTVMLSVVMLSAFMQSGITLSVILPNVVLLRVLYKVSLW